jgi:hypothetical protein
MMLHAWLTLALMFASRWLSLRAQLPNPSGRTVTWDKLSHHHRIHPSGLSGLLRYRGNC